MGRGGKFSKLMSWDENVTGKEGGGGGEEGKRRRGGGGQLEIGQTVKFQSMYLLPDFPPGPVWCPLVSLSVLTNF